MRSFKKVALISLLALTAPAMALDSTNTTHNSATMTLTASGTASDAVKFTVGQSTLTIPAAQVRPGASFTVSVPVSNPTGRNIKVTGVAGTPTGDFADKLTITGTAATDVTVASSGSGTLTYTFTFDDAQAGDPLYTGNISVTFTLSATADDTDAKDLSY